MKKIVVTIILIFITVILMVGCTWKNIPQEPPELSITIKDKDIKYVVGKNIWNGLKFDREDIFQTILKEDSNIEVPNIDIGEIATIKFKNNPPNKLIVYDVLIDERGNQIYSGEITVGIPVELEDDKYSFEISQHMALYLSLTHKEEEVAYRGFRMVASWGENECEYGFVIRTRIGASVKTTTMLNKDGNTIKTRYNPPEGFIRIGVEKGSFGLFLRDQKLKPYGEKALYYNGRNKRSEGIYDSVIDVDIGIRDLHQCADAIMLLRAEYLYSYELYDQIKFNFVGGFLADYQKWMEGYRIHVEGDNAKWVKQAGYSVSYESFRKYMDMVFAYSGTLSLEKELVPVGIKDINIGDVFIQGGSPGHAVIVVDMAQNDMTGEKVFMLAQSYMPAQQTQILINPNNEVISPWYSLNVGEHLMTPEWKFEKTDLKGF